MRKIIVVLLSVLMSMAVCVAASAKEKAKPQYPHAVLTLNDSTVITGYLRNNLHNVGKDVAVSETCDGKKMSYKIADINSLKVTYPDGQNEVYIPIRTWKDYSQPTLATVCFTGNHVVGYRIPTQYIKSTVAVPSSNFQSYSWNYEAWVFAYRVGNEEVIRTFWVHIPVKKAPKLKSIIKKAKKDFKDYPVVAETIVSDGLTADTIIQNPCILLDILDKHLE